MKNIVISVLIVILLTACSSSPTVSIPTETSTPMPPTLTASPTFTPTPSATYTITPSPTSTATPTSLPEELRNALFQTYKVMLFTHLDVELLKQVASRVNKKELTGFDSFGALLAVATLINTVDEAIPQTQPPASIQSHWEKALPIHESTKRLLSRWYNKEIDSGDVLVEVEPILAEADQIMTDFEQELSSTYGFDPEELKKVRDEAVQTMDHIFDKTPTPES